MTLMTLLSHIATQTRSRPIRCAPDVFYGHVIRLHANAIHPVEGRARSAPLLDVDVGLLAADVGKAAAHALDRRHGERDLLLAVHVRGQHTQNVREVRRVHYQTLQHNDAPGTFSAQTAWAGVAGPSSERACHMYQ